MPKVRLTDVALRALKPPAQGNVTYWDDTLPSFGVRVSQGGTKTFYVMHGAHRERTTIGRYPVISLADARTEAKRILAERTLGKHRVQSIPCDEAQARFLEAKKQTVKPRTHADYTRLLKRCFNFGKTRLEDITTQDINRRIDKLKYAPAEQNHAFVVGRAFFNWAKSQNYIDRSPVNGPLPARTIARDRVLSDRELAEVYRTALAGDDTFSRIVALLILTGQRRGEIAALEWSWIDEKERTITLPASLTKNRRAHTFPLGDKAAAVIENVPRLSDTYLFPAARAQRKGKPATTFAGWSKPKVAFDKKLKQIAPWTLHDLRRTFATGLAELGVPIHVTEKFLNHVSGSHGGIVAIYQRHTYLPEMRDAIALWEEHLQKLLAAQ